MNLILKGIVLLVTIIVTIQCDPNSDISHISIFTINCKRTSKSIFRNVIYKMYPTEIIHVEVPSDQMDTIKKEFNKYPRIRIQGSIYTYEQISIVEKTQLLINLNMTELDDEEEESDYTDIVYYGNQFLSQFIYIYYLSQSGYSLEGLNHYRQYKQVDNSFDEELILLTKQKLATLKQQAVNTFYNEEYLTKKIKQQRSKVRNYFDLSIGKSQFLQTFQKYIQFTDIFWRKTINIFSFDEVVDMMQQIILLELKEIDNEDQVDFILIQQLMNRPVIYFYNQSQIQYKEINQSCFSVYSEDIEKTYQQIYFRFLDPSLQFIEVPKEQHAFIVERISGYYNTSIKYTKQRIIASLYKFEHVKLLIKQMYMPQTIISQNNSIILQEKMVLSHYIYGDTLNKREYNIDEVMNYQFLSIISRAEPRYFCKAIELIYGKKNLFSILNQLLDWYVKLLPKKFYESISLNIFSKRGNSAALTSFQKFFRIQKESTIQGLINQYDFTKLVKGRLTQSEFFKNQKLDEKNIRILAQFSEEYIELISQLMTRSEIESIVEIFRIHLLAPLTIDLFKQQLQNNNWQEEVKSKIDSIIKLLFSYRLPLQVEHH